MEVGIFLHSHGRWWSKDEFFKKKRKKKQTDFCLGEKDIILTNVIIYPISYLVHRHVFEFFSKCGNSQTHIYKGSFYGIETLFDLEEETQCFIVSMHIHQ
jgi:hypothetical protein